MDFKTKFIKKLFSINSFFKIQSPHCGPTVPPEIMFFNEYFLPESASAQAAAFLANSFEKF